MAKSHGTSKTLICRFKSFKWTSPNLWSAKRLSKQRTSTDEVCKSRAWQNIRSQ